VFEKQKFLLQLNVSSGCCQVAISQRC